MKSERVYLQHLKKPFSGRADIKITWWDDDLAMSLARMLAAANKKAREAGVNVLQSLITITQYAGNGDSVWRINYGPRDYVGRWGGGLIVEVDASDASIKQVRRGQ